jgi:hypothetical protein
MKIRNDQKYYYTLPLFQNYWFLEKKIRLPHEETKLQVENTEVQLVTFQMAMSHIENKEALTSSIEVF